MRQARTLHPASGKRWNRMVLQCSTHSHRCRLRTFWGNRTTVVPSKALTTPLFTLNEKAPS
eukprot:494459-Rhodomonas_salina.1